MLQGWLFSEQPRRPSQTLEIESLVFSRDIRWSPGCPDWLADLCYLSSISINLEHNWQNLWQKQTEETAAEIITSFHLSRFWFEKGKACDKSKRGGKNRWAGPVLSQYGAETLRKVAKEGRRPRTKAQREMKTIPPRSNEIKQSDTEKREINQTEHLNKKLPRAVIFPSLFCGF